MVKFSIYFFMIGTEVILNRVQPFYELGPYFFIVVRTRAQTLHRYVKCAYFVKNEVCGRYVYWCIIHKTMTFTVTMS